MKESVGYKELKQKKYEERIVRVLNADYSSANKRIIKRYYAYLTKRYSNFSTKMCYLQHLRNLILDNEKDIDKLNSKDIDKYLVKLSNKALRTQYERKKFLFLFFPWQRKKSFETIVKTILKDIKLIKPKKELLEGDILEPSEILELIKVQRSDRDRAIISTLYETGARKGEFLQLKLKHIKRKDYGFEITIPRGKTNSRKGYLVDSFVYLNTWLEAHPERDNPNANLWITQGAWLGRPLGEDGLKRLIKQAGLRADIKKRIYPHLFRHSRCSFFAKQGKNEDFLRRWFGWSPTSKMPSHYVHTFASDTEEEYLQFKGVKKNIKSNKKEIELLQHKNCPRCKTDEIPTHFKFCPRCFLALDIESAMKIDEAERKITKVGTKLLSKEFSEEQLIELARKIKELKNQEN